jgi:hypothetical protein
MVTKLSMRRRAQIGLSLLTCAISLVALTQTAWASGKVIPSTLKVAIQSTMRNRQLRVVTSFEVISPKRSKPSTAALDFQYPDRVETEPRTIELDGRYFGSVIYVDNIVYLRWPFPSKTVRFSESKTGPARPLGSVEEDLCFYPLLAASNATSFTRTTNGYTFSRGVKIHGTIVIHDDLVVDASVVYSTPKARNETSRTDRQVANYSFHDDVLPIVVPPKANVS